MAFHAKPWEVSRKDTELLIVQTCLKHGIIDESQIAYVLASAYHESAVYSKVEEDKGPAQAARLRYNGGTEMYGRGLIQLTHDYNYRDVGRHLGMKSELLNDPDLATNPEIAVEILVQGMQHGYFTGKKLDDYVDKTTGAFDSYNARAIVNGDKNTVVQGNTQSNGRLIANTANSYQQRAPNLVTEAQRLTILNDDPIKVSEQTISDKTTLLNQLTAQINGYDNVNETLGNTPAVENEAPYKRIISTADREGVSLLLPEQQQVIDDLKNENYRNSSIGVQRVLRAHDVLTDTVDSAGSTKRADDGYWGNGSKNALRELLHLEQTDNTLFDREGNIHPQAIERYRDYCLRDLTEETLVERIELNQTITENKIIELRNEIVQEETNKQLALNSELQENKTQQETLTTEISQLEGQIDALPNLIEESKGKTNQEVETSLNEHNLTLFNSASTKDLYDKNAWNIKEDHDDLIALQSAFVNENVPINSRNVPGSWTHNGSTHTRTAVIGLYGRDSADIIKTGAVVTNEEIEGFRTQHINSIDVQTRLETLTPGLQTKLDGTRAKLVELQNKEIALTTQIENPESAINQSVRVAAENTDVSPSDLETLVHEDRLQYINQFDNYQHNRTELVQQNENYTLELGGLSNMSGVLNDSDYEWTIEQRQSTIEYLKEANTSALTEQEANFFNKPNWDLGERSEDSFELQRILHARGNFDGPIDGRVSGAETQAAFREAFDQDLNNLFSRDDNRITSYIVEGTQFSDMADTYQTTLSREDFLNRLETKHAELGVTNIDVAKDILVIEHLEQKHQQQLETYISGIENEQLLLNTKINANKQQLTETTDPEQITTLRAQQSELTSKYETNVLLLSQLETKRPIELTKETETLEQGQTTPEQTVESPERTIKASVLEINEPAVEIKTESEVVQSPVSEPIAAVQQSENRLLGTATTGDPDIDRILEARLSGNHEETIRLSIEVAQRPDMQELKQELLAEAHQTNLQIAEQQREQQELARQQQALQIEQELKEQQERQLANRGPSMSR